MEITIGNYLLEASRSLENLGIQTSRLDTLLLLERVLGKDRGWILAHDDEVLYAAQIDRLNKLLNKRQNHLPMAYILGEVEFYGREFIIGTNVLVPRPETETMIDLLKETVSADNVTSIADVGTGCGALGITARLELPRCAVYLLDIDEKALKNAKMNVDKFTLDLYLIKSDLLSNLKVDADVLLCNLPYVPDDYEINQAAKHEPKLALFGGPDGLDLYRRLFAQIEERSNKPLYVLTEAIPSQHTLLQSIAASFGYKEAKREHFIQLFST